MRFNFISECGDSLGFAVRVLAEGNDVRMWIRDEDAGEVGNGLVEKVGNIFDLFNASRDTDVFVFDCSYNGVIADKLRSDGYAVMGGSVNADKLELDRHYATEVMHECGIETPRTWHFEDWEIAKDFIKRFDGRLAFKPSGSLGEMPSYVSYGSEDLLEWLDNLIEDAHVDKPEFELQEFLEGVALSTEIWFDGERLVEPLTNHTLERKQSMVGDLGPSGGCVGNILWACGTCPVCKETKKLLPFLRKIGFHGMIDLNAIVNDDGIFGLEFTPRFGYDASPTMFYQLVDGEISQVFHDFAKNQYGNESPSLRNEVFVSGVRLTIPPWPTEKYEAEKNVPIRGLPKNFLDFTYLYNVKADSDNSKKLASAGAWGILLLFTGRGSTINRAFSAPYEAVENARVPDKQYRTDLREVFTKDLEKVTSYIGEVLV